MKGVKERLHFLGLNFQSVGFKVWMREAQQLYKSLCNHLVVFTTFIADYFKHLNNLKKINNQVEKYRNVDNLDTK